MATVTGMTASAIDALMDEMVISFRIDENGQMIYKTRGNVETNAGPVIAPTAALQKAWPIGSIYIGTTATNPSELIGVGTWARYGEGRVLLSQDGTQPEFDVISEVGGAKNTTLSVANLPSHAHSMPNHSHSMNASYQRGIVEEGTGLDRDRVSHIAFGSGYDIDISGTTGSSGAGDTGSVGSTTEFSNLPPYIVVYMWRRSS